MTCDGVAALGALIVALVLPVTIIVCMLTMPIGPALCTIGWCVGILWLGPDASTEQVAVLMGACLVVAALLHDWRAE